MKHSADIDTNDRDVSEALQNSVKERRWITSCQQHDIGEGGKRIYPFLGVTVKAWKDACFDTSCISISYASIERRSSFDTEVLIVNLDSRYWW
jgi:23S rRNA A1618 N6-methylase RlmF